ncbi:transcription repressor OFP17-like [Rutidosis leptorrhynchoides]|uniref:transcription repressor OFP17-like n=1 Tax=Rutidosis leptorrhynchoides TaxID=125765 RepID=UPI003A99D16A
MITKPTCGSSFTCKKLFTTPCKTFIHLFKFKKPIFIRRPHSSRKPKPSTATTRTRLLCCLPSFFKSLRKKKDMDRVMELKSFSDAGYSQKAPCPSPLTPAYIKMGNARMECMVEAEELDEVEDDACRNFENYLVKMISEEGKMKDLVDVEELLYCWKNLKSPVFVNLVCRFYGELCKDLFSSNGDNDDDIRSLM